MSNRKDKERAEAGQPHRVLPEDKQLIKCQYPPCSNQILIDKVTPGIPYKGSPPFCRIHLEMLNFYMWCMTAVRIERQQTPSGVILPGNDKFEAVLREQRIPIKGG